MVQRELAPGREQPGLDVAPDFLATVAIDHHAHFDPRATALEQRIDQPLAEDALLPEKRFEMHRLLGGFDFLEQHVEKSAVLEQLHAVADVDRAVRQPGERGQLLRDGILTLDPELRGAMVPDRPNDYCQDDNEEREERQRQQDRYSGIACIEHGGRSFSASGRDVVCADPSKGRTAILGGALDDAPIYRCGRVARTRSSRPQGPDRQ